MLVRGCLLLFCAWGTFWVAGCDSGSLEDDDPEAIERVVLRLTRLGDIRADETRTQSAQIRLNNGQVTEVDTLFLDPKAEYTGRVEIYNTRGINIADRQIPGDAEHYLVRYTISGLSEVNWDVTDRESDYGEELLGADLAVGLAYNVRVDFNRLAVSEGQVQVQLTFYDQEVKNNQGLGVTPLAEVTFPVQVTPPLGPGDLPVITSATLRIGGSGAGLGNDNGLVNGERGATLFVNDGQTYLVSLRLFNGQTEWTDYIDVRGDYYHFEITPSSELEAALLFRPADTDLLSRPIGLRKEVDVSPNVTVNPPGELRVRGYKYDPEQGGDKNNPGSGTLILDFIVGLGIQ